MAQKIGDVSDILFDKDRQDRSATSLGRRRLPRHRRQGRSAGSERLQVVPGDKSKNESDKLRSLSMTKDELKQARELRALQGPRASTTGMARRLAPDWARRGAARLQRLGAAAVCSTGVVCSDR